MKFRLVGVLFLFIAIYAWSESQLSLNKTSFVPGETIEIRYSTSRPANASAWVGIIPSNVPHGTESVNDQHDVAYQYIPKSEGSVELQVPLKPGSYDIRMNYDGIEVVSAAFPVIAVDYKASIRLNKNTFTPGE